MKNYEIIRLIHNFKSDDICTFLPTAAGTVKVTVPRRAVIEILRYLGKQEPSPCHFYVRGGVGYIIAVGETKPPRYRLDTKINVGNVPDKWCRIDHNPSLIARAVQQLSNTALTHGCKSVEIVDCSNKTPAIISKRKLS